MSPPVEPGASAVYELIVVGSGEGGKYLAWTMAKQGKRVLVIERKYIGGSCPNIACLPSKNIIHSAKSRRTVMWRGGFERTNLTF